MKKKLLFLIVIMLVALAIALMFQFMWHYVSHNKTKSELIVLAVGALLATPILLTIRKYTD